jgi:hypothetical protein
MDELSGLERRIKKRILQIKRKMHETLERAVTDRLWSEIETLNWVLNEILSISRKAELDIDKDTSAQTTSIKFNWQ